jgi:hypothetical protein
MSARRETPSGQPLLPAFAGWRTYGRGFVSVLLLGLAALAGEWVVHQIEYRIEYGARFDAVMATTPHRFYMAPLGLSLLVGALVALLLAGAVLRSTVLRRRALVDALPPRIVRLVPENGLDLRVSALLATALVLAVYQIVLYVAQENLEVTALGQSWPGLAVLLAPMHATVLPLHALIALCTSLLLWTVWASLHRSSRTLRAVRALARLFARAPILPVSMPATPARLPDLRLVAGVLCLRSPPRLV